MYMENLSYHTRISFQDIKYVNYLADNTPKSITVYEDADEEVKRDHLHSIHHLGKKELQFKKLLKLKFTELGAGNWACRKNDDTIRNLVYVCKGKSINEMPIVMFNNWLTPDEIIEYHALYWANNAQLKADSKKEKDLKAESFQHMVNRTYQRYEQIDGQSIDKGHDWVARKTGGQLIVRQSVLTHVLKCLGKKAKGFDFNIINRLVNGCMLAVFPYEMTEFCNAGYAHWFENSRYEF